MDVRSLEATVLHHVNSFRKKDGGSKSWFISLSMQDFCWFLFKRDRMVSLEVNDTIESK